MTRKGGGADERETPYRKSLMDALIERVHAEDTGAVIPSFVQKKWTGDSTPGKGGAYGIYNQT
jgi:hypothetical protein